MTTTLITGSNKGLGYEAARRLLERGHDVWVSARDEDRGQKASAELGARFVQLDVTSEGSVAAAVQTIGHLDVLINNAGIALGWRA
jgi:NAD(P)-dependent dehydrogenase (short-subunit alcohol dehydrogenase family)